MYRLLYTYFVTLLCWITGNGIYSITVELQSKSIRKAKEYMSHNNQLMLVKYFKSQLANKRMWDKT